MRRGALVLAACAVIAAAAIVVASSSAGGAKSKPYRFSTGVLVADSTSVVRVYVTALNGQQPTVKVTYTTASGKETDSLILPANGVSQSISDQCMLSGCEVRVDIKSPTAMIAPSVRYQDTDGNVQEKLAGDFVVTRDNKRLW